MMLIQKILVPIIEYMEKYICLMCAGSACGPYGHDIHLAEICAAWNSPPIKEMTREEYEVGWW
jgi:hypothetical protein